MTNTNIKVCGYYLDQQQMKIVLDESKHTLVTAGAGSGKTLTILGKISYLLNTKNLKEEEILCISFTQASSKNLQSKIKQEFSKNIPVYTFHKLALTILKNYKNIEIADSHLLEEIIHSFFNKTILQNDYHINLAAKYFNIRKTNNLKTSYLNFYKYNNKKIQSLEKLLITFIHLFKCNNFKLENFKDFLSSAKKLNNFYNYKKEKAFLIFALNIYLIYQNYLKEYNEMDFDDMIIKASDEIKANGINSLIKYIIIDEYQDTSFIRFELIKNILNKTNANLLAVGDDYQSIFRFTGCDLSLFLHFNNLFTDAKTMKIENTYRNSQELITTAGAFITKNKEQIKKNLVSQKKLKNPIKIIYYKDIKESFKKLILKIYNNTQKPILVLVRNNNDINLILDKNNFKLEKNYLIYLKNKNIKIYYLTVHKAKGLEEENTIIINLIDNVLGFPNKIENDKILRFVSKNFEKFPFSEERRLFYVALTRTKNYVYLLASNKNPSIFIKEIERILSTNKIHAKHHILKQKNS